MSKEDFENELVDRRFMTAEAVLIVDDVIATRTWWHNPPGKRSTRVSVDASELSKDRRSIVNRNLVAGWQCQRCGAVLFGTCAKDLLHLPCCAKYIDVNECVEWLSDHAA